MNPSDVLARTCSVLGLSHEQVVPIFASQDVTLSTDDVAALQQADCTEGQLLQFLDGLILDRRGPPPEGTAPRAQVDLSPNVVLKKLRIALSMQEPELLAVLSAGGAPLTSRELAPLFRKPGTKNHRVCAPEVLDAFLAGLAARHSDILG